MWVGNDGNGSPADGGSNYGLDVVDGRLLAAGASRVIPVGKQSRVWHEVETSGGAGGEASAEGFSSDASERSPQAEAEYAGRNGGR